MKPEDFDIILSKNRLARTVKNLYKEKGESIPESVKFDFDEIEKKTGVGNQPTGRDILESNLEI